MNIKSDYCVRTRRMQSFHSLIHMRCAAHPYSSTPLPPCSYSSAPALQYPTVTDCLLTHYSLAVTAMVASPCVNTVLPVASLYTSN